MDSAVVWPDSGMEFVNLSLFFFKKTDSHPILSPEAERKNRQKEERDGPVGVAGNTPLPQ